MKAILLILILSFASACSEAQTPKQSVPTAAAPVAIKTETKAFTNSIGTEFISIHAGSYMMGASESDREAYASEKPQHKVTISKPFSIGRYEVTQANWEAVMGSNPYTLDRSNPYYNLPGMKERITKPNHPATVSWKDTQEFIKRLNAKEGHNRYRLPTEAEWEYAARAGTTSAYSFGDDKTDLDRYAWRGEGFGSGGTHPVGQKLPNPWGLYDIHGNAWEWVQDRYSGDYYAQSSLTDPTGPTAGSDHPVRGGSWHVTSTVGAARSATRMRRIIADQHRFRVVMTAE